MTRLNFLFLLLLGGLSFKAQAIQIDRNLTFLDIGSEDVEVILDPERAYNIDNIPLSDFKTLNKNTLNFGFYDGAVWVKFRISAPARLHYILELKNPYLDEVKLFLKKEQNYFKEYEVGDKYIFEKRVNDHRYFHFPLDGSNEVLMRIDNLGDQFYIPIKIFSEKNLNKRDYEEQFVLGIYYGIILFVLIFNLFLFFRIKLKSNFYYVLYLFGLIILQLALGGHGFQYLYPYSPYLANHMLPIMASLGVLFLIVFTQSFLQLAKFSPKLNRLFNFIMILLIINTILSIIPTHFTYKIAVVAVNVLTLMLNIAIIPVSIFIIRKKFKPARFFFLAFLALFFSVFIFVLRNFGMVAPNFLTQFSLQIGSAIEVILLSFAIVDRFKMYKDEALVQLQEKNELIEKQTVLLEEKVESRTIQLKEKSNQLEYKNKEILDSINYAVRIQDSLMPMQKEVEGKFEDAFVYFKPKDIVSGDFYWINKDSEGRKKVALADCTGHGVPGAMLSILGINNLNNALKSDAVNSTSDILEFVNKEFNLAFSKENTKSIRDGMDIALCSFNKEMTEMEFSGANSNIYIIRNNKVIQYRGDRNAIGSLNVNFKYTSTKIELVKGDIIYLFSDGYPDQFGGEKNKKLKYKAFKNLLLKIHQLPIHEQKESLDNFMLNWRGSYEQIDDISIIGIKV